MGAGREWLIAETAPGPCWLSAGGGNGWALLQQGEEVEEVSEADQKGEPDANGRDRALLCAACRHLLTRTRDRCRVHGKHAHVFFNPAGIVFEVGCFQSATGCISMGGPTLEFTWFDGYAWRISLCAGCGGHVGWQYLAAAGEGGFYGLILGRLVEGES